MKKNLWQLLAIAALSAALITGFLYVQDSQQVNEAKRTLAGYVGEARGGGLGAGLAGVFAEEYRQEVASARHKRNQRLVPGVLVTLAFLAGSTLVRRQGLSSTLGTADP